MGYRPTCPQLPAPLTPLRELASNLRWSWHPPTQDLFDMIGGPNWRSATENPLCMLSRLDQHRLKTLAHNKRQVAHISALSADLHDYLRNPRWYQLARERQPLLPKAIACIAAELGGAHTDGGEYLRAASDLGLPVIAVGLRRFNARAIGGMSAEPLIDHAGRQTLVYVDLPAGRTLWAEVWRVMIGRVPLLLLDSDIPNNDDDLRDVKQQIQRALLIGVGGVRAVRTFCQLASHAQPDIFHCIGQESTMACMERIRELVSMQKIGFDDALAVVRASTVCTVPATELVESGRFDAGTVRDYLDSAMIGQLPTKMLDYGMAADSGLFELNRLGLWLTDRPTGLSTIENGAAGRPHWPGVHGPSWEAREISALARPVRTQETQPTPDLPGLSDAQLWQLRKALRARLIRVVRERMQADLLARGTPQRQACWTNRAFNPDILTLGASGRRIAGLLARQPEWLSAMLLNGRHPVQWVLADVPDPRDFVEMASREQLLRLGADTSTRNRIVFLPAIDTSFARELCAGVDVWLNEPPSAGRASRYGMRAAVNGVLNVSFRNDWWREFNVDIGWVVDDDGIEPSALFEVLTQQVLPTFYQQARKGSAGPWIDRVRRTLAIARPEIQSSWLVSRYVEEQYQPAAEQTARSVRRC